METPSERSEIERLEARVNLALAYGRGSSQADRFVYVLRPGGVAGGNVFTTWASLYAAMLLVAGPKWVKIDDSIAPAHMTTAVAPYALDGVTFTGLAGGSTLLIDNGAHITPASVLVLDEEVGLSYAGAGTCMSSAAASDHPAILLRGNASLVCTGAGPFLHASNGSGMVVLSETATLGDGAHTVVSAGAPGVVDVWATGISTVAAAALSGAGVALAWDSATVNQGAQGGGVTFQQHLPYTPATPADWGTTAPTQATVPFGAGKGALDSLASILHNHQIGESAGALLGVASPNYQVIAEADFTASPEGSGKAHVEATAYLTNSLLVSHTAAIGVVVLPAAAPAPTTLPGGGVSYPTGFGDNAVSFAAGASGECTLVFDIGAGGSFPTALTPGSAYKVYLMATADVTPGFAVGGHGTVVSVQEQL